MNAGQTDRQTLMRLIDQWPGLRVLVIGDLILDEYRTGIVSRVSPEAPVPVVRVDEVREALGGAGNVARNVVSLGAQCELVGIIGRDAEGERFLGQLGATPLASDGVVVSVTRSTTHKLRVVADTQQKVRLDREETQPPSPEETAALRRRIDERLPACDLVILEDYDKGVLGSPGPDALPSEGLAPWVIGRARALGRPVVADPKTDLRRFRGADLVKPNWSEATAFAGRFEDSRAARASLLEKLHAELGGAAIVVTRGSEGMSVLDPDRGLFDVGTQALAVYDVQGAGDTAVAALALSRAAGAPWVEACIVANAAGGVAVEKIGTAAVDVRELRLRIEAHASVERVTAIGGSGGA